MEWIKEFEALANADQERFRKIINYLLNKTFMLREIYENRDRVGKINSDYRFIERNFSLISDYLSYSGYKLEKDDANGVIFITNVYEFNVEHLDKLPTIMLITLRSIFDEKKEVNGSRNVCFVSTSEIISKMIEDHLIFKKPTIKEYVDALRVLIRHNILSKLDGAIDSPSCVLTIYPTITKIVSNEKVNALYTLMFEELENPYQQGDEE